MEAATATAGRYEAAGPYRILDTRNGTGAPAAPPPDGGTVTISFPADIGSAVILNVTATETTQPGFVTVWPAGQSRPLASSLNVERTGQTIANLVIVPIGGDGVSFYVLKSMPLVADVLGYFSEARGPASDQGLFVPLDPQRILDSRALAQRGGLYTQEVVGDYRADLQVAGRGGVPASGVGAVIANVTSTDATEPGFVTVYPAATNRPLASKSTSTTPARRSRTSPSLASASSGGSRCTPLPTPSSCSTWPDGSPAT